MMPEGKPVHIHDAPTGDALALKMRPTTAPSTSTSKSSSFHSPDGRETDARLRISWGIGGARATAFGLNLIDADQLEPSDDEHQTKRLQDRRHGKVDTERGPDDGPQGGGAERGVEMWGAVSNPPLVLISK
jgi:hypothetical protein